MRSPLNGFTLLNGAFPYSASRWLRNLPLARDYSEDSEQHTAPSRSQSSRWNARSWSPMFPPTVFTFFYHQLLCFQHEFLQKNPIFNVIEAIKRLSWYALIVIKVLIEIMTFSLWCNKFGIAWQNQNTHIADRFWRDLTITSITI